MDRRGVALMNHALISLHTQHQHDIEALSFLEDVWIVRDPVEMRCFTLEFVRNLQLNGIALCLTEAVYRASKRTRTSRIRC